MIHRKSNINYKYNIFGKRALKIAGSIAGKAIDTAVITGCIAYKAGEAIAKSTEKGVKQATEENRIDKQLCNPIIEELSDDELKNWTESKYKKLRENILKKNTGEIYSIWSNLLSANILFQLFGYFVVIDKAKKEIENVINYKPQERMLNVLAYLYMQVKNSTEVIKSRDVRFKIDLNKQDDIWLSKYIYPFTSGKKSALELGSLIAPHYNNISNKLLNNLSLIERITSAIAPVIQIQNTKISEMMMDIVNDPTKIYPIGLISKANIIGVKILPGIIRGKEKDKALKSYETCKKEWDFFLSKIIPALIIDTNRNNLQVLSRIVERDEKLLGKAKWESTEIKEALFRRCFELEAYRKVAKMKATPKMTLSADEIIKKLNSLSEKFS